MTSPIKYLLASNIKLKNAGILILLFTTPKKTWDWCLYEVGLFRDLNDLDEKPVVCVHKPGDSPPDPLKDLAPVKADVEGLSGFLENFYGTTEITKWHKPINKKFSEKKDEIKRVAEELSRMFISILPITTYINSGHMIIEVKNASSISKTSIPDENNLDATSKTHEIFGWVPGERKWDDIEKFAKNKDEVGWVEELKQAMHSTRKGYIPPQIKSTFNSVDNAKKYRPSLYKAVYAKSEDTVRFYLDFFVT